MKKLKNSLAILLISFVNYAHGMLQRATTKMVQRTIAPIIVSAVAKELLQIRHCCGIINRIENINERIERRAGEVNKKFSQYHEIIETGQEKRIYDFYKGGLERSVMTDSIEMDYFNSMNVTQLQCFIQTYMTYQQQINFVRENISYLQECKEVVNHPELDEGMKQLLMIFQIRNTLETFISIRDKLIANAPLHYYVYKNHKIKNVIDLYKQKKEK